MPSTIRESLVRVPVLSKQQMSILPANGILNGSVQNTSVESSLIYDYFNCVGQYEKFERLKTLMKGLF